MDRHHALKILASPLGCGWLEPLAALWVAADAEEALAIFTREAYIGGFRALVAAVEPGEERIFLQGLSKRMFEPPHQHTLAGSLVIWAEHAPALTLVILDDLGPRVESSKGEVLRRWVKVDVAGALEWAKASQSDQWLRVIGQEWAKRDFKAAFDGMERLLESDDRLRFITSLPEDQTDRFVDWLESHPEYTTKVSWSHLLTNALRADPTRLEMCA